MNLESSTKKIIKKAAVGLVGSALVLGSLGLNGCESLGREFIYGAAEGAGREAGKELIRGGQQQQSQPQYQQNQSVKSQRHFFACNYWEDFNHNGAMDYPEEFVGIKSVFKEDEQIVLIDYDPFCKMGQTAEFKLYSPRNDFIDSWTLVSHTNNGSCTLTDFGVVAKNYISRFGYGRYHVAWYLDGQLIGGFPFTIVPSQ